MRSMPSVPDNIHLPTPHLTNTDIPSNSSHKSKHNRASLEIDYRRIDSLKPYAKNARTHSKRQIRKIRDSIEAFGFVNPVLISAERMIVAGHGRVQAAKLLGMVEVPTICLDDLTEDQIRAYVLADNRLALDAGWDEGILKIELQHLSALPEFDVSVIGFEVAEIDLIIGSEVVEEDPDDQLPEEPDQPIARVGDKWTLGDHRIHCGDARTVAAFEQLMGDRRASIVFTDPPFNQRVDGHVGGNGRIHHPEFAMASGEMTEAEYTEFLIVTLGHLVRWSLDGSVHFIAMDWPHQFELLSAGRKVYSSMLNLCVWAKDNGGMGSLYRSQHELFFVFKVGKKTHRNNIQLGKFGRYRTNVWNYPGANSLSKSGTEGNLLAMHPTVKPVGLIADALLDCSARGEIVLDAFLGSGSALLAAERVGRICYGMEIEPRYVDLSIRRWQQMTGQSAHNAATGVAFNEAAQKEVTGVHE